MWRCIIGVALLLCCLSSTAAFAAAAPWWMPSSLKNVSDALFTSRMELLANASKLAYTSTYGSYYRASSANATLPEPGWVRYADANPEYGFHAIAFVHHHDERILFAIRGTDLNVSGLSGQADVCADYYLWTVPASNHTDAIRVDGTEAPPAYCSKFNWTTLDYFTAARAFVNNVTLALQGFDVMYTGHSLGAGLAAMLALWPTSASCPLLPTAAGLGSKAAAFSAPDYLLALRGRTKLLNYGDTPATAIAPEVVIFADEWDPIHVQAMQSGFHGMIGELAVWRQGSNSSSNPNGPPSFECLWCDDVEHAQSIKSPACLVCMMERHIFSHYIRLVQAPGLRPTWTGLVDSCFGNPATCGPIDPANTDC